MIIDNTDLDESQIVVLIKNSDLSNIQGIFGPFCNDLDNLPLDITISSPLGVMEMNLLSPSPENKLTH